MFTDTEMYSSYVPISAFHFFIYAAMPRLTFFYVYKAQSEECANVTVTPKDTFTHILLKIYIKKGSKPTVFSLLEKKFWCMCFFVTMQMLSVMQYSFLYQNEFHSYVQC